MGNASYQFVLGKVGDKTRITDVNTVQRIL